MDESNFTPEENQNGGNGPDPRAERGPCPHTGREASGEQPLMNLFTRTNTLLHRYLQLRLHSHAHDPHRGQGRVLSILRIKPEISQRDLAYLLDMRSQSLGELLMKLERAGYITRTPSEEDRRGLNIRLTDAGKEAAEQTEKDQCYGGRLFDCLNAEEQAFLRGALKKLAASMEGALDAECDVCWDGGPRYGHEFHKHGRDLKDHVRAHSQELREQLREHGRDLRDCARDLRRDLRRDGGFWDDRWQDGRPEDDRYEQRRGARFEQEDWDGPRAR